MRFSKAAIGLLLAVATALSPATLLAGARDYVLVWSDEFDGAGVDPSKWEFQVGDGCPSLCGWGNAELQYYRAENAIVAGGELTITAREENFGGRAYTSARMRTLGLGDWTYGRFEMRARMPVGQGLWPAFWMLPSDQVYGGWAASGEIDVMEYLGHDVDRVSGAIHYGGSWPDNLFWTKGFTLSAGSFATDMHDFAVEWSPHEIRWYVDGQPYACQSHWRSTGGGYPAPFDDEFHLLLNMAVGGNLPGSPDATTSFPQDLVVDHVRVYQRPEFPQCEVVFDGLDHANPWGNGWFNFNGSGFGGIGVSTTNLPPDGCNALLTAGWGSGGSPGFLGGFGRTSPRDLTNMTHFSFWINPVAGQDYTIEINLQDDDDGDDSIPGAPDGADDEFQYNCEVSAVGPCAIAGGGWQRVTIPLTAFFDDNSYHFGGNGVLDPFPTGVGGNGQLVNVVLALISNSGSNASFRTDSWRFTMESASITGRIWDDLDGDGTPDAGEPGLNGIGVNLLDSAGTTVGTTTTAADGVYQFTGLPWDEYTASVQTGMLPAGMLPTFDPDGLASPHTASVLLGCSDAASGQDFGYDSAAPDPVLSITVARNGAGIDVFYDVTCNASDHALLYGSIGDFTTVTAADCSIGNSGTVTSAPPVGNVWFLVAGREAQRYSSVGQATTGERTLSGVQAQCPALTAQDLSATCP